MPEDQLLFSTFVQNQLHIITLYPNLSYLFHDLFGTRPDNWLSIFATFGLLLVICIFIAALILRIELKRKEKQGLLHPSEEKTVEGKGIIATEVASNGLWGFIIGFKLIYLFQNYSTIGDPMSYLFSTEGNLALGLVGALIFGGYNAYQAHKTKLPKPLIKTHQVWPHERVWDIAVLAGLSGIIGAKLFAAFESIEGAKAFLRDPLDHLLSGSGLAIYGGLIVAFAVVYRYVAQKGIKPIHVMDAIAPSLILGYGVGRLGCQLSGDGDWGVINKLPVPSWWILPDSWWAYDYPHNVLKQGIAMRDCEWEYCYRLIEPVFPTPIYEIIASVLIFGILWALRKKVSPYPGMLFFLYMIFSGIERYYIEKIRVNDTIPLLGMEVTQAEIISVLSVLGGLLGCVLVWRRSQPQKN